MARPREFNQKHCDILDGLGHDGEGVAEAIVALGICKQTFYTWKDQHPEFLDAVNGFLQRSQAWWEKKGRGATFGDSPGFSAASYIFNMKNRFRDDWKDRQEVDFDGRMKVEGVEVTFVDPSAKNS